MRDCSGTSGFRNVIRCGTGCAHRAYHRSVLRRSSAVVPFAPYAIPNSSKRKTFFVDTIFLVHKRNAVFPSMLPRVQTNCTPQLKKSSSERCCSNGNILLVSLCQKDIRQQHSPKGELSPCHFWKEEFYQSYEAKCIEMAGKLPHPCFSHPLTSSLHTAPLSPHPPPTLSSPNVSSVRMRFRFKLIIKLHVLL